MRVKFSYFAMPTKPTVEKLSMARVKETYRITGRLFAMVWRLEPRLLSAMSTMVLVPSVLPFINAYIYKLVIDAVIAGVNTGTYDTRQLATYLIARIVTYFVQDAAYSLQNYTEQLLWTRVPMHIHRVVFEKLAVLDMPYFEDPAFHTSLEKISEARFSVQNCISSTLYAVQSFVQLSIAFVAIVSLNWLLIPIVALVAVPEFIYQLYESRAEWSIWTWNSPLKKRFSYLGWLLKDIASIKEIRIFQLAPLFIREAMGLQEKFYADNKRMAGRSFRFRLLFNGFSTALFIGVEIYVIFLAFAKRVTVGDISFYTQVVTNFQGGLGGLLRNVNQMFEYSLYVKSIFEVLDAPPRMTQHATPLLPDSTAPQRIVFDHVSFRYPHGDSLILQDVSFTIEPGERVAFVGENGAGKSTIIKLLARFYDPTEGRILIGNHDLRELDIPAWHRCLGVLFQDFNRYDDTVRQNIYYGNVESSASMESINRAAVDAGALPVIQGLQKTFDQMLGKRFEEGVELSTGQWQKMALARAYFRNAPILVLDEPTAAIDAKAEAEIFERVEELSRGKTVILISHRFSTVRTADRIVVLDDGRVLEEGSHDQLMTKQGLYAELFNLQAKGYR